MDLQLIDRYQSTSLMPHQSGVPFTSVRSFPKEQWYRPGVFFSPLSLSFFRPSTYPKGYYFYSPQSSSVIKSKMAATTIRTWTSFCPPKIRLHCWLIEPWPYDDWTVRSIHWGNQANYRVGHCEFEIYPMVEMTWIETSEMTHVFWTADKDVKVNMIFAVEWTWKTQFRFQVKP